MAVITDILFSHSSLATRDWLAGHPRIEQVFIPKGACWLNLQGAWWRIFRRHALAGQTFADSGEIAHVTELATAQLNAHAKPWVWGRPRHRHDPAGADSPTCFEEHSTISASSGRCSWPGVEVLVADGAGAGPGDEQGLQLTQDGVEAQDGGRAQAEKALAGLVRS
jgi:hypothetical protein